LALLHAPAALANSGPERWTALGDTVFNNYSIDQGLPHEVVTSIAQDRAGFIWIGTQGGLSRWDGYRFHNYEPSAGTPGALPDNLIETLHTDPEGRLWIGMNTGGLARHDPEQDSFVDYAIGSSGRVGRHVSAITDDGASGLWVGTDNGLAHLDRNGRLIGAYRHQTDDPNSLSDDRIRTLLMERDGRLWIGTQHGLLRQDAEGTGFIPVALTETHGASPAIDALFQDRTGHIWIGTEQDGAYFLDTPLGTPRQVDENDGARSALHHDGVRAIAAADDDEMWIATDLTGIVAIDTGTGRSRRIQHDATEPTSLPHDGVRTLLRDRAGSMWVGGIAGIGRFDSSHGAVTTLLGASSRPNGLDGADVYAAMEADDGKIWLGFLSQGLEIIDPEKGRVSTLRVDPTRPESALPKDTVTSMVPDQDGRILIGTWRGVYQADPAGKDISLLTLPKRDPHAQTYALLRDASTVWIGGTSDGLWRLSSDAAAEAPPESAGLTDQRLLSIARDAGDDLWVGTFNGLNRIDLANHTIEKILGQPTDSASLPQDTATTLLFDKQARLWVGTLGGGIAMMTGRDANGTPQFRRFGLAEGVPSGNIDKLLLDHDGRIWASTHDGIAVIDPVHLNVRALHRADGVAIRSYWVGAGTVTRNGELLFGGKGGLTVIRPDRLQPSEDRPPIVVTDVWIGGKPMASLKLDGALSSEALTLTPESNSLAVEFAALDYTAPEANRYAYWLEGFDPDWIATDASRRLASYTNLPAGRYTLHLRGANHAGLWTAQELALPVIVLAAWYQTLWFKFLISCIGIALILGLVQSRTVYLRQRQRVLAKQIEERTHALEVSSDNLRIANSELEQANAELARLAHHDPLTGLGNRRRFFQLTADHIALARRHYRPCSVFMIDLDHFKQINDRFGHAGGDETLRRAARCAVETVREVDIVARFGGEELAVFLPETAIKEATQVAERFRKALEQLEIRYGGHTIRVTASIGVAAWSVMEPDIEPALNRADAALYEVKKSGRNGVGVDPLFDHRVAP
jgi:diguanylate cyclase (GGDEF)-like protein